ncbi:DUF4390 domain-containing protein [Aquabacterium sp.]|uniref:DUF4390 domain-containing protein n=1 Tax=Aquabacterium sp. TaxID=1872578 RepID=UPI0035B34E7E
MTFAAVIVSCLIAAARVAARARQVRVAAWLACGLLAGAAYAADAPTTAPVELRTLNVSRADDGVLLDFAVHFDLPRGIEEGLNKGVPLYFVAEAELMQSRWYWRDKALAHASRTWRLAYQPLTRNWRVSVGGLHQHFAALPEALLAITRSARWKIADPLPGEGNVYLEFSYRLDTTQLPRPLQIGLGGQVEWALAVQRNVAVPDAAAR